MLENYEIGCMIEFEGKEICPIKELFVFAMKGIGGSTLKEGDDEYDLRIETVLTEDDKVGAIGHLFDDRFGFTLNIEDGWKEFKLSSNEGESVYKLDQLAMFDQLRRWGFKL